MAELTSLLRDGTLAGWVESWPFKDGFGPEPIGFSVSYEHPAVIRAKADFGEIQISHSSAVFGDGLHERGIRSAAHFVIRLNEPHTIDLVRPGNPGDSGLDLDQTTVLVGANDTGKSAILEDGGHR